MIHCPKLPTFQMKDSPNLSALTSALVKLFQCKPHMCPQVSLCIGLEGCLGTRIRVWKPQPLWPQNRLAQFLCVPSTSERPRPVPFRISALCPSLRHIASPCADLCLVHFSLLISSVFSPVLHLGASPARPHPQAGLSEKQGYACLPGLSTPGELRLHRACPKCIPPEDFCISFFLAST